MESSENNYRQLTLEEVADILTPKRRTLILFHVHPDGDAVGSAFALKLLLDSLGSKSYCVSEEGVPERLSFAVKKYQSEATPESIPAEFLNDENLRIVTVDSASPNRLGSLYESFGVRAELMIDHHSLGTPYADNYIRTVAATGQIIFELMKIFAARGLYPGMDRDFAECAYMAVSSDTGCFRYNNSTPDTLRCAAELVETGIDIAEINRLMFEVKSKTVMLVESEGMRRLEYYGEGKISVLTFPYELKVKLGVKDEHLETLVDVARAPEGVLVAVAIKQSDENKVFRVSMRSSCNLDVSQVCAKFGGGGHVRASGCTVEADSIEDAAKLIVAETEKQMKEMRKDA